MFRLVLSCLVFGIALAEPSQKGAPAHGYSEVPEISPRDYGEVPEISPRLKSVSGPQPLPAPDREERDRGSQPLIAGHHLLDAGMHFIESPNYPSRYPNNAYRTWLLLGKQGQVISISCPLFRIQRHRRCAYDFLYVNGKRFCGSTGPNVSDTNLLVTFRSNRFGRRKGFKCTISVPNGNSSTAVTPVGSTEGTISASTSASIASTQSPSDNRCCGIPNRASRIVGGVEAEENEYPWQAGLVNTGRTEIWCGGSVIKNRYVLTAAHCTAGKPASRFQVLLGEHRMGVEDGEKRFTVERIIEHPSYTSASGSGYDFALLKLSSEIAFGNKTAPICLPTGGNFDNVEAIVSGWGTTSLAGSQPTELREVTVQTMTNAQCSEAYGSIINNSMLCAGVSGGGKDSCHRDSGGPLVTDDDDKDGRYTLIGVVSWGRDCALANFPGVYARVTEVTSWIDNNTSDANLC